VSIIVVVANVIVNARNAMESLEGDKMLEMLEMFFSLWKPCVMFPLNFLPLFP
jgi:hypothetical protein